MHLRTYVLSTYATADLRCAHNFRTMSSFLTSESERRYTIEGCEANLRVDGRSNSNYRPYIIEASPFLLCNGSSRVHLPNRSTDVVCSVKAEIVHPTISRPSCGIVEVNAEFLGGATRLIGINKRRRRSEEMELSQILSTLLINALHLDKLCIVPGRYCWKLYVDVLVISCSGNAVDACSMAVYAALNSTCLPVVTPVTLAVDGPMDGTGRATTQGKKGDDLLVDGDVMHAFTPPGAKDCPITVTLCRLGKNMVMDCRTEEEICASAKVSVSVDTSGRICGVHKSGEGSMPFRQISEVTKMAVALSGKLFEGLLNPALSSPVEEVKCKGVTRKGNEHMLSSVIEFR